FHVTGVQTCALPISTIKLINTELMKIKFVGLGILLLCTRCTYGSVTPARLFQSNMVLQRDKPCKIWGTAERETRVMIHFNGRSYQGDVQNGKWEIELPAQKAGGPYQISITGEN